MRTSPARAFWIGAAGILILGALVALTAVLDGDFSETDARILGTLGAVLLAGATLVSGLTLVDRHGALLGRVAAILAVPAFVFLLYPIWEFGFDGSDSWRFGWTGALLLLALLMAVTARLLARSPSIVTLAAIAGVLAGAASAFSAYVVWDDGSSSGWGQTLAALWIFAVLAYLLVPVLQRFTTAGVPGEVARVLDELDGVELIATRAGGFEPRLAPGERLQLRRRV